MALGDNPEKCNNATYKNDLDKKYSSRWGLGKSTIDNYAKFTTSPSVDAREGLTSDDFINATIPQGPLVDINKFSYSSFLYNEYVILIKDNINLDI